jgi:hypothetical protein
VRLIPTKRDIAFVEYADEASATAAKDALHNFKIDGETKMKVGSLPGCLVASIVRVLKWIVRRSRSPGSRPSKRHEDQRSLFGWVSDALMYTISRRSSGRSCNDTHAMFIAWEIEASRCWGLARAGASRETVTGRCMDSSDVVQHHINIRADLKLQNPARGHLYQDVPLQAVRDTVETSLITRSHTVTTISPVM